MDEDAAAPWPLMTLAIGPKRPGDEGKIMASLQDMAADDPSLSYSADPDSSQIVLHAMSERDLDVAVDILRRRHGVDAHIDAPQVAYRETLTKAVDVDYTHKTQVDGVRAFARVMLRIEPAGWGAGVSFSSRNVGGVLPEVYVSAVETGFRSAAVAGVVAGFPVVDVTVELRDGAFHEADSSGRAFEAAASAAFREGLRRGDAALLEPIMRVDVSTPGDCVGAVVGDLISRRGAAQGPADVEVLVPLASLFGYRGSLLAISKGRAECSMRYARYERVPTPGDDGQPPAAAMALRA